MTRPARIALVALWLAAFGRGAGVAGELIETPMLAEAVKAGQLPPVGKRVPVKPRVIDLATLGREPGRHGGQLRMLMGDPKDLRWMTVYSYARLVTYDVNLTLVPDILESFEVSEGRIFTFRIRPGHRWSDGRPLTPEDFRYFWEDVANNEKLSPTGPPVEMLVNRQPPKLEILDQLTIRYTWASPNPAFLPALAGAHPLYI
jgi:peptide/nickel transport system substrate-binding protein